MKTGRLKLANPDLVCEEFDGELVVLDLETGKYFGFDHGASAIWNLLQSGIAPSAIEDALGRSLDPLITKLVDLKLVTITSEEGDTALDPQTRTSLACFDTEPTVEVFDDLADLIRADPVHDVDQEAGWPHQQKASAC
ncbi:PqqD family protein [Breoghania sp. JC706]|uniref:PqqD family protein n=1 Tax=Breoghania sp. JC706 TaxID=3117732 RepID=UPI00300A383C